MPGSDLNDTAQKPARPGYHQSQLLARAGFQHAFFTRQGGASEGPFESLSFSTAVGDVESHVNENLRRAGNLLGVAPGHILYLSQVHGREARFYSEPTTRNATITLEGDAIGGCDAKSAYGVRSADCVPVLVADTESGAVMAIHAGWRGVAGRVVEAGVACLREGIGKSGRLLAAIGPHISLPAFEVSEEVATQLAASCPVPGGVSHDFGAKPHADLRFIVTQQLYALGLTEESVDQVGGCTYLDRGHYFSFRRDGKHSGRHLSAIVPRP
jgi:polyphenol oxidase